MTEEKEEPTVAEAASDAAAADAPAPAAASDADLAAIQERLSFFFSAANIRQDTFLRRFLTSSSSGGGGGSGTPRGGKHGDKSDAATAPAGMIPIATLLRFHTLQRLTTDPALVAAAAAAPPLDDLLVLSEDRAALGLKAPWREEQMDENLPLTLVVENLPVAPAHAAATDGNGEGSPGGDERMDYVHTTEQVRELFAAYGTVTLCRLRFRKTPVAPGSGGGKGRRFQQEPLRMAFVEFATQEECERAAADTLTLRDGASLEPKRPLTLGDATLAVRTLTDYIQERKNLKEQDGANGGAAGGSGKKRGRDDAEDEKFTIDWKPGCVIRLEGLPAECDREAILDAVAQGMGLTLEQVKEKKIYADFSRGQTDGAIRFLEPEGVTDLCQKLSSGDLTVGQGKVETAKVLDGDDETKYWDEFIAFKNKQMKHQREERSHRKRKHHHKR